ncbi:hypothetical protein OIU77_010033, partial [Salix suchowensis]
MKQETGTVSQAFKARGSFWNIKPLIVPDTLSSFMIIHYRWIDLHFGIHDTVKRYSQCLQGNAVCNPIQPFLLTFHVSAGIDRMWADRQLTIPCTST